MEIKFRVALKYKSNIFFCSKTYISVYRIFEVLLDILGFIGVISVEVLALYRYDKRGHVVQNVGIPNKMKLVSLVIVRNKTLHRRT